MARPNIPKFLIIAGGVYLQDGDVVLGSRASFDASGGDFRFYPERRHSLALHQVTLLAH